MKVIDGNVVLEEGDFEILTSRGFDISKHTEYYLNGITVDAHGFCFGFHCYVDNLEFWISSYPLSNQEDSRQTRIFIKTDEDLEKCLKLMDCFLSIKNLKSDY